MKHGEISCHHWKLAWVTSPSCHCMAHTHLFFFSSLPLKEQMTSTFKKNHCYVVYAAMTHMQKIPGLPGSTQPCKVKICNTKTSLHVCNSFRVYFTLDVFSLRGIFYAVGHGASWGSLQLAHGFAAIVVRLALSFHLAHVWMTWGLRALYGECALCCRDANLEARLFTFLKLWNSCCLKSLMTSS